MTKAAVTVVCLFLFGAVIFAQGAKPVKPQVDASQNPQGVIHGTAVDGNASPMPNATVRMATTAYNL